jgi:thiol:disulfide interchange protein
MRYIGLLIITIFAGKAWAQELPITTSFSIQKEPGNLYRMVVTLQPKAGWYIYAQPDPANSLEPLQLTFDESVETSSTLTIEGNSQLIKDKIFTQELEVYKSSIKLTQLVRFKGNPSGFLHLQVTGYAANGDEFIPLDVVQNLALKGTTIPTNEYKLPQVDLANPAAVCGKNTTASDGMLTLFFMGFLGGLIALLTPCLFPMIPVTVSFFTNRAADRLEGIRNGVMYGIFIFAIYLAASIPFHLLDQVDPQLFNTIATNAWVNLGFFAIFIIFALSFFGFFELTLPSWVANATARRGGTFFMALTLVIVSFSCTGIILGTVLVNSISKTNGAWELTSAMAGFGLALGIPFGLFAIFPHWLKRLPKSGSWMDVLKKTLAFVELGLAIKFLSNADLVEHWGILKREIFIGAWILIAISLSIYLFRVSLRKGMNRTVWSSLGGLTLLFAIYMIPGLLPSAGNNLKLLSGFPPPMTYSLYEKDGHDLKWIEPNVINDYKQALALSKETGKPILIDFTGWACVNCRKMEELVWTRPEVAAYIKENFILVSLYVDDRAALPAAERTLVKNEQGVEQEIRTVGDRWALFQQVNFKQVTQPLYVILDKEERIMNHPIGYTPDGRQYLEWLDCGARAAGKDKVAKLETKTGRTR